MENWIHAEWTTSWVGSLPFILISLSCPLNVSLRAGLIGFSRCTPFLFKDFAQRHSLQSHFSGSLKKRIIYTVLEMWQMAFRHKHEKLFFSPCLFKRTDFQITWWQGFLWNVLFSQAYPKTVLRKFGRE